MRKSTPYTSLKLSTLKFEAVQQWIVWQEKIMNLKKWLISSNFFGFLIFFVCHTLCVFNAQCSISSKKNDFIILSADYSCARTISENERQQKGMITIFFLKMKQPVKIDLVINETVLSNWHTWTLPWMPSRGSMQHWYSSLWCSQIPHITSRSWVRCQTGSHDLLLISLYDFLQWHSHSTQVIWESMGPKDWCGFRNLNFLKSYMSFWEKVSPLVLNHCSESSRRDKARCLA